MDLSVWISGANERLVTGLFLFARFGAMLSAAPLVSSRSVPHAARVGLSAALAMIVTPLLPPHAIDGAPGLIAGLMKEVVVGLALGWTASLLFAAVQMAGEWIDLHAGFQMAHILNPAFETQNAVLGNFKYLLAGVVFLGTGGYTVMIRAAVSSLAVSPPGVLKIGSGAPGDWTSLLVKALWISVQLVAPIAAATFLAEVATALLSRALPQMNVLMLTLPAKALLAVCAVALTIPILARLLEAIFTDLGADLTQVLRLLGG